MGRRVVLRLSGELYDRIAAIAAREERTVEQQVRWIVRAFLESLDGTVDADDVIAPAERRTDRE